MDLDGDGLSNTQEVVLLTNPLMWDSNGDGLSDSEDIAQGYDPNRMDLDYDGINNAQEILAGTDPFDFYNGIPPVITIVSGNQQTGAPESVLPVPLKVMLKNAAGEPIVYGPVTFQVVAGGGTLANPQAPEPATFTSSIIIRTTVTGEASVIFKVPVAADFSSVIRASAKGPANPPGIDFTEYNFGATLTFSPAAGHYGSPVSVTVDTTVSAGVIRYTIDGSEPTVSSAELPAEGLSLLRSTRLKARAFHNTTAVSGVSSALYLIGSLISAGDDHTFANGLNGTVYAWGHNSLGQLGNGSRQAQLMPTVISIPSAVDALSGGGEFAIALDEAGVVLGWGDNYFGQLGNNSSEDQLTPLALVSPRSYRAIAAGKDHALAVASDGTVWSWGNGSSGQLGDGTLEGKAAPTQVSGISNVIKVAAGRKFSLAVDQDGRLWAWGLNQSSQIGSDEPDQVSVPVQLPLEGELVQTVSAGATHGLVLTQSGFVYTWGGNGRGELGDATGVSRPVLQRVEGLSDIIAISAGQYHCLALSNTGVVYSWGANDAGQLGDGSHEDRLVPVAVTLPAAALDVAAGMNHSAVVLQDGRIFTFGDNQRGQLGVTTPASSAQPLEVATFHLFNP